MQSPFNPLDFSPEPRAPAKARAGNILSRENKMKNVFQFFTVRKILKSAKKTLANERFCVKCGKTSNLLKSEDMCYGCAKERGRI